MFFDKVVPFLSFATFLCVCGTLAEDCSIRKTSSKLFCYYSKATDVNSCQCTHVVLPLDADVKAIDAVRHHLTDVKVLLTVDRFSESLVSLLNTTRIDGLDLRLAKLTAQADIQAFISTIRSKLGADLILTVSVPARAELLAKHYDFKALSKHVDSFVLETAFLGASGNVTFHPSRLSGVWDMQNTDSVVDLVTGLGAPLQKLVIAAPVQAFKFTLQDAGHTAPGSPALELSTISRGELCHVMSKNKWTVERDQDQAGPYIFRDKTWIAFEDPTSIDIKSKYSRIRGLAGLALKDLSQDAPCAPAVDSPNAISILEAAHSGLTRQSRAPRGAVLQSLEREILGTQQGLLDTVQVSPYRITRVVDTEGKVHAIRQDTRTEFECARQGYFVHPRSCGRFYRCVKFDQLSDEYSVFEFDCPAGLVFDARVEVCVWPGSLPQASACSGSSEIAPVPRERFICPGEAGYYADAENCRWFFACLDHGKSPLSAYEFRCPFGLVFDQERLLCEWPWLVPKCSSGFTEGTYEEYSYGGIGTGALAGSGYVTTEDNDLSGTGLILGQYNGLGSLKSVSLGGLSGPLVQPVAKVYSSFSSAGLLEGRDVDANGNMLDYKPIGTSAIGHGHRARLNDFVDESHLINGNFGVKLYKINNKQQDVNDDFNIDVRLGNFASGSPINLNQREGGLNLIRAQSGESNIKLVNSNSAAATSFANINQQHIGNLQSVGDNINIIGGGFSAVGGSGVELSQHGSNIVHVQHITPLPIEASSTIAPVTNVPVPLVQSSITDFVIYKGGVVANIPSLQYKVSPGAVNTFFNQGYQSTASSINNHTLTGFEKFVSSSTPIIPVAFVSSIPIIKSTFDSRGFSGYNYEKPSISFVEGSSITPPVAQIQHQGYDYQRPIVSFVEEEKPTIITTNEYLPPVSVTTVQPPVLVVTKDYLPPVSVSTIQTPIIKPEEYLPPPKTIQPITGQSYSYSHQNQIHTKVEQPVVQIQQSVGYEIPQPQVVKLEVEERRPQLLNSYHTSNQAYNAYNYAHQQPTIIKAEGYSYPKPTIKFEDIPTINQVFSHSQVQQSAGEYNYPKPTITFEEKPTVLKVETQPQGYIYPKPAINFEENPSAVSSQSFVQHNTFVKPVESKFVQQIVPVAPKVVVQENIGYTYPKPSVQFVEEPLRQVVKIDQYPRPAIKFEHKPAISSQSFIQHVQQTVGYQYPKPQIKFEEKPLLNQYIPPKVVQGYTYPKPVIKFEEKPIVTQYVQPKNQQQIFVYQKPQVTQYVNPLLPKVVSQDYSYPRLNFAFEEKPLQHAVSSQSYVQHHTNVKPLETKVLEPTVAVQTHVVQPAVQIQQNYGYSYPEPTIKFEERPVIQQTYVTPQPTVSSQVYTQHNYVKPVETKIQAQQNYGYVYAQPTVKFEEKPVGVQQTYVTPQPIVHVQENIGYEYSKPTIKFEEKPAVVQHTFVTPKPVILVQKNIGYSYPKPSVKFEEKPAIIQHTFVTPKPVIHIQENIGYSYPKQSIKFEEKPAVIEQTFVTARPVVQPVVHVEENIGYTYPKPAFKFVEKPVVNYVQPVIEQTYIKSVQPVVHIQENIGYVYPKPAIRFEEKPVIQQAVITAKPPVVHVQQNVGYEYPKPLIIFEGKPVVIDQQTNYVKPIQPVSSYSFSSHATKQYIPPVTPVVQQNIGYAYPKPAIKFEEKPVRYNTYSYENVEHKQQTPVVYEAKPIQPAVLPTYSHQKPRYFQIQPVPHQHTYIYEKPVEQKIVQVQQPAVTQTYHYQQKPVVQQVQVGYEYPKPHIKFGEKPVISYENRQPVQEEIIVPKKAYVSGYQKNEGYVYNKPSVAFEEVRYEAPRVTPRPTYVSTVASVVVPKIQQQQQNFYSYDTRFESRPQVLLQQQRVPIVEQKTVVESKPFFKYEFSSLDNSFNSYVAPPQKGYVPQVISTTQRYIEPARPVQIVQQYTTPKSQVIVEEQKTYEQSKPIAHYEFSSFDKEYKTYIAPPIVQVQKEYLPVQTTPKFVNVEVKQSRPIAHYEFSSFDSRFEPQKVFVQVKSTTPKYVGTTPFQINVPDLEYLPVRKVVIQPPKVYIPASTTENVVLRTRKPPTTTENVITIPKRTYLPVTTSTTERVIVTKPNRGYLPVKPDREYLPVKTGKFIENYVAEQYENSEEVVSRRPAEVVKIVRPKSKSIIKVNDFHPILSTKLGAQCTCTSNTLRLRKPAKKISVEVEEPDTRIGDLEEYIKNEEETGDIIIEDYQYEPQKLQDQEISVTRTPVVILKSTTEELHSYAPAPNLVIKKRLRVHPASTTAIYDHIPVSRASDIFIRRSNRPKQIVIVNDEQDRNDEEIADAVKNGLKLVKSAVKEGVKEGLRESAIESKTFDRYGAGGVRSRSETLQGTIDCQRAGLFRHPTHCNKFYACRWDCKKNRFTLHVFNCPVHLTFDNNLGACNWPSQGPACVDNTLLPNE